MNNVSLLYFFVNPCIFRVHKIFCILLGFFSSSSGYPASVRFGSLCLFQFSLRSISPFGSISRFTTWVNLGGWGGWGGYEISPLNIFSPGNVRTLTYSCGMEGFYIDKHCIIKYKLNYLEIHKIKEMKYRNIYLQCFLS